MRAARGSALVPVLGEALQVEPLEPHPCASQHGIRHTQYVSAARRHRGTSGTTGYFHSRGSAVQRTAAQVSKLSFILPRFDLVGDSSDALHITRPEMV
ncbi:hypothetical protein BU16DRAFT_73840 [Lophium mytilinum]|uniref:Uncharacterized protein n=1 Tax=Lophium mytilinum TaxID=390894 RepID=A0A6A6QMJ3_9PEZI|nr:hypothetical protein BU16DRAFT_73840 [Lophium mytilinum]